MYEKLRKAEPSLLMTWMLSAFVSGFGLGALLAGYLTSTLAWGVFAIAGLVHLWTMYAIYSRK